MKKAILSIVIGVVFNHIWSQEAYWQQHVDYKMEINFFATLNKFDGKQQLIYTNNSPDTLEKIFYHLYYNAFQPGSMMDVRSRTIEDPDSRVGDRISKLNEDEIGLHTIHFIKQKNTPLKFRVEGTILEVFLSKPLFPGEKTTLSMNFSSQVPVQIRRTGRHNVEGVDFSMTQWYPKLCEYDKDGWHSNPYIGREFHGVWGDYDVKITIDSTYVLGGTGIIQNPNEVGYGYQDNSKPLKLSDSETITWHFKAKKVHDFAWAADPDFIHDTSVLENGTVIHYLHIDDSLNDNWLKLKEYAVKSFNYVNKNFGTYPYKQYSIIQGGDGGMEYPMCTLITAGGTFKGLVSVTVHESIHSWFQGLLATNESKYEWMDEGFCTYAQYMTMDHLFNTNYLNPFSRQYRSYIRLANSEFQEPLSTHADFYKKNYVYGVNACSKGAVFLSQLGYIIGDSTLMRGMKRYYYDWRFKHPTPQDFKRIMEKESGLELDWYFEQFINTTNRIDYSLKSVDKVEGATSITLSRVEDMPMPIDILVKFKDGSFNWFTIPLRIMRGSKSNDTFFEEFKTLPDWPWVYPEYTFTIDEKLSKIEEIIIDPTGRLADVNQENNKYPFKNNKRIQFKGD